MALSDIEEHNQLWLDIFKIRTRLTGWAIKHLPTDCVATLDVGPIDYRQPCLEVSQAENTSTKQWFFLNGVGLPMAVHKTH